MKTLILYALNEINDNFIFFCKNGHIEDNNVFFLFISNHNLTLLSSNSNHNVLHYPSKYHLEKWYYGLCHNENYSKYEYFFFINEKMRGPLGFNWLNKFINKLNNNTKLIYSDSIDSDAFILDRDGINILINNNVFSTNSDNFLQLANNCILANNYSIESVFTDNNNSDNKNFNKKDNIFYKTSFNTDISESFTLSRKNDYNLDFIYHVRYGISINMSSDVTDKFKDYFYNNNFINNGICFNDIFGDPYSGKRKSIFIIKYDNTKLKINEKDNNKIFIFTNKSFKEKYSDILFYYICHDDKSYEIIKKYENYEYVKIIMVRSTKYFESMIFKYMYENINEWIDKKYVGILTYSCENKINKSFDEIYADVLNLITNNYDIITLYSGGYTMYPRSFVYHPKLEEIFDHIFERYSNIKIDYSEVYEFFCNYWISKVNWMIEYIIFFHKIISILEDKSDFYLQDLINSDSNYKGNLLYSNKERLIKIYGYPYYGYHCFITERLPYLFFHINKVTSHRLYFYI
jgi:hypothetical protein